MAIVYVANQGTILKKKGDRILVKKNQNVISWFLLKDVEEIILLGNVSLTPGVIKALLENGIDVVFLSFYGKYRGKLVATPGKNIFLRIGQFNFFQNEKFQIDFAKRCVRVKLKNYISLLRKRNYRLKSRDIAQVISNIRGVLVDLEKADNLDEIRGIEGIGTKFYFEGFRQLIKETDFSFAQRTRRPPRDEVNALMSFYYTLFGNRIASILNKVGLDPYLGALHSVEYGRPSLALDLLEEYRPFVDNLILTALNKKVIKKTDFHIRQDIFPLLKDNEEMPELDESDYPVLLTHSGIKTAINYFENAFLLKRFFEPANARLDLNQIIEEQARSIARFLQGKSLDYYDFEVV